MDQKKYGEIYQTPNNGTTVTFSGKLNEKMMLICELEQKNNRLEKRVENTENTNLKLMAEKEELGRDYI